MPFISNVVLQVFPGVPDSASALIKITYNITSDPRYEGYLFRRNGWEHAELWRVALGSGRSEPIDTTSMRIPSSPFSGREGFRRNVEKVFAQSVLFPPLPTDLHRWSAGPVRLFAKVCWTPFQVYPVWGQSDIVEIAQPQQRLPLKR
jgi:hypothetical protein